MDMKQDYYLGLDLGTGSLGWAVTDEKYEILRKHGNALWGVRLFENANTAEERRSFRTARRRLDRRNWRIELLQDIFAAEINKVDEGFYLRMKESRYVPEDKRDMENKCPQLPYALFVDTDYTDKDYHKQFPTIYHLRKWLMTTEETPDIRLVYLALHHIMKHRGHYLFTGNIENIREFKGTFTQFIESIKAEELDFDLEITKERISGTEEILKDSRLTRTAKKTRLNTLFGARTTCEKAVLNLICGGKVSLKDIFGNSELDYCERPKISFSESGYDEYVNVIEAELGEQFLIIAQAKAIYDWAILADILGTYPSISEAKTALYEKHGEDLIYLKKLVREKLGKEVYQKVFVKTDEKTANYSAYIGMTKVNGKKQEIAGKQCSKEDFYAFLKKEVIARIEDEEAVSYMKEEIEKGSFLPKQVTKDNGVIPHQIHLYELRQIINNLKTRIPLLAENEEKLCSLFAFRIPYYVGPLNGIAKEGSTTHWVQKKKKGKIFPWNFDEIVDEERSAEQFIRRMTNKCTYLIHEDVLPKNSMLYSKFMVLNELNNLRIDGEPISVSLKQQIYTQLFQRYRKVTQKKLKEYLLREGVIGKNADITGIDGDFKSALTAYHDLKEKLTDCNLSQNEKEDIILNITLFGEDKKLLNKRLEKLYPDLSEKQRKGLCSLSYTGWGRLSKAFLEEITAPLPEAGEVCNIIQTLWETNDNLMQVLSDKYLFAKEIEKENGVEDIQEFSYDLVEQLRVSPAVKRQIWQTLQIIRELGKVMGKPAKRIFVEMAREKAESQRTKSRKNMLLDLYKSCKEEERNWIDELGKIEEHQLRSDKLYLYYTQKGRCMYSGEVIRLEDLWDNHKYDIDHIYPQSKVMDDSLDNRVLVKKTYNAEKTDVYPISAEIQENMQPFWKSLLEGKFISKEKYERLIRKTEFEPSELAGFIARQLVETRQSTKAVASILKQLLPETEIVYVKARIVSQFRQDFDLIKVREMNDLHHAKDAYLNIVAGNVYFTKFTNNPLKYVKEYPGRSYNLKRMFTSDKDIERNGSVAWKSGENGTICTVRKVMNKNNILVTRRSYEMRGGLFDQQLMKKGKGQVPVKGSDERLCNIEKYGGYNNAAGTYFMLVESEDKKGNKIRTVEYVPLYLKKRIEQDETWVWQYLVNERKLKSPKIVLKRIKKDTLFKVDGFYMWLSGRQNNQLLFKGAMQLILSYRDEQILKKVTKFVQRYKENKNLQIVEQDKILAEDLLRLYDTFLDKLQNTLYHSRLSKQGMTLNEKRDVFTQLNKEEQCIVLYEILHMFQCQSGVADLKLIGGPGNAGKLLLNNNITKYGQISIINQSPTGIYQQEIDLKTI
ncbi:MAG: type II CRISPR RNA-guided endonuclease Cas9 [Muribaculaceae bacterium]|nr:type II CRISPR RNA-guided endonuclease Cas9 [Muribaculaceae bacterium]